MSAPTVMLVAAEPSGDLLGAKLSRALRRRLGPDLRLVGVGGDQMAAEGVASDIDVSPLAVVGVFNGLRAFPAVLHLARRAAVLAVREKPDVAVLIDAWGFNLRVARRLRGIDRPPMLVKYVAPQVWATRPGRARTLAHAVDLLLTIHAFDSGYFEVQGLPTRFVGNPALALDVASADGERFRASIGADPDEAVLLVAPGSRTEEVRRLLPPFQKAVRRLRADRRLRVAIVASPSVATILRASLEGWSGPVDLIEGEPAKLDAMRGATVALACSGTVTTELAMAGAPMVVAYRLGPLTHAVAARLIRTRFITLFNVAAQAFVAPELVQERCTPAALASEIARRLDDPALRAQQVAAQSAALDLMRGGIDDPVGAAADAIVDALANRQVASA